MSIWPSVRAAEVLRALARIGWTERRQRGSHRVLAREGWRPVVFAFRDRDQIGPAMLAKIARQTGLQPEDFNTPKGNRP